MQNIKKVATYNVCHSRRATNEYTWGNRVDHIVKLIKRINADVLCVQEIPQEKSLEFIQMNDQYHWFIQPQNSRGGKFTNIGICVSKKIAINDIECVAHNFNQYHQECEMAVGCIIKSISMLVVSVHFPMELSGRKSMVKNFPIFLEKYKYDKLIICGDFNCFPDSWGYQQMPMMNAISNTYPISQYSVLESTQKFAEHSFVPYPYDIISPEALNIGTLDAILCKGVY